MPWMKVLRKPRLNRTVVRVAVDTAVNFSRLFSLSDMATPFFERTFAPSRRVVNSCGQTSRLVYEHRIYAASYDGAAPWRRLTSYSRGQSPKSTIGSWFPSSSNPTRAISPSGWPALNRGGSWKRPSEPAACLERWRRGCPGGAARPQARRPFSFQRVGPHLRKRICRCRHAGVGDALSARPASLHGPHPARLSRCGNDPRGTHG